MINGSGAVFDIPSVGRLMLARYAYVGVFVAFPRGPVRL